MKNPASPGAVRLPLIATLPLCLVILSLVGAVGCNRHTPDPPPTASKETAPTASSAAGLPAFTNMVLIKAGTFFRGKFPVTVTRDFWLGKYEVTQAEYAAIMGKNPSHFQGDPTRPVEKVSHFDAAAYCSALSRRERGANRLPAGFEYRLPTEAEWELACRAGTTNLYSFGDNTSQAAEYAWTLETAEGSTHPVGQKLPNPWGLHDMHGNVWEWCQDWFTNAPGAPLIDPRGPGQGQFKVFRGGSWNHALEMARPGNRFMMSPSNGIYFVGFRAALSPE